MTTHRFNTTPFKEFNHDKISFQPSEIVPLINTNKDIPSPPPIPSSMTLINETNKPSNRLFNNVIQRLKTSSSSADLMQKKNTSSLPIIHSHSATNLHVTKEPEETDSYNTMDTNSLPLTNKFLHELRVKRRELHHKARHLSIDQRIALNRFHHDRDIIRAQDIFDVNFELDDDEINNSQRNIFNEDTQEKIRNNIFHELDRQRIKQFHKQHRQLVFGRALLIFITSLLIFMSITLIYVVIDLYNRASYIDAKFEDNEFLSTIYDKTTDV